jgi:hypothetical protein
LHIELLTNAEDKTILNEPSSSKSGVRRYASSLLDLPFPLTVMWLKVVSILTCN